MVLVLMWVLVLVLVVVYVKWMVVGSSTGPEQILPLGQHPITPLEPTTQ